MTRFLDFLSDVLTADLDVLTAYQTSWLLTRCLDYLSGNAANHPTLLPSLRNIIPSLRNIIAFIEEYHSFIEEYNLDALPSLSNINWMHCLP